MKNQKGITLIALIVTIIVLIILAGISVSLLLGENGLIQRAKDAAGEQERAELIEGMKLAISNKQILRKGELTQEDIEAVLGEYGTVANGNVTTTKGGHVIAITEVYNGEIVTPQVTTYPEYLMGDTVTLGGEEFWVIENSNSSKSTVKLLAKLCVKTTSGEGQNTQTTSANNLRFDFDSNVYYDNTTNPVTESEIKKCVDDYKAAVEGRMGEGKKVEEARLMTGTDTDGELQEILGSNLENKLDIVYGTTPKLSYWLGSPYGTSTDQEWLIDSQFVGSYDKDYVYYGNYFGLRPVLIVLKSNI